MRAKFLKYIVTSFSGILILLVLLVIIFRIMFPPEKLKEFVYSHFEKYQGRKLTFGSVDFSILRGFAVDVGDFKISEDPEFQRHYFFQADHFLLRVKLLPLLSRSIEIDRLSFIKPEIFLEKNAQGKLNTHTLFSSDSIKTPEPQTPFPDSSSKGALPFAMLLSSATISDGIFHYIDRQNPFEVSLAPINTDMSISIDRKNASLNLSGEMDISGINITRPADYVRLSNQLALTTTYTAAVNLNTGNLSLKEFTFDIAGITGKCTGIIPSINKTPMNFSLSCDGRITDIRKILSLIPSTKATLMQPVNFSGEINFRGKIEGDSEFMKPLTYQLVTDIDDGSVRFTMFPREIKKLNIQANISNGKAIINKCDMLVGEDPLNISGTFALSEDYPLSVVLKTTLCINDIPRIVPSLEKWKAEGKVNTFLNVQGLGDDFSSIKLNGTINGQKLIFTNQEYATPNVEMNDVLFDVSMNNKVIKIDKMIGKLFSGNVTGTGNITIKDKGIPDYSFDIETENLQAGQTLVPMTSFGKYLDGLLTSTIHLEGSGTSYESIMKNLYSKGRLSIKEGQLKGLPLLSGIAQWSKIAEWENLPFLDWHGEFYIQNQRPYSNNFTIKTSEGDWTVAGSAGFDYSLDYRVQVALSPTLTQKYKAILPGNILSWLSDAQDRVLLNFKVAGTYLKPQSQWDTSVLTRQVRKKITQQVDEEAKKILQRVLPHAQSDSSTTEKKQNIFADTAKVKTLTPEEITKKAVEQFKNIFKRKK